MMVKQKRKLTLEEKFTVVFRFFLHVVWFMFVVLAVGSLYVLFEYDDITTLEAIRMSTGTLVSIYLVFSNFGGFFDAADYHAPV